MSRSILCAFAALLLALAFGCGSKGEPGAPDSSSAKPPAADPAQQGDADLTAFDPHDALTDEEASEIFKQKVHLTDTEQVGQFRSTRIENESNSICAMFQISSIPYTEEQFVSDVTEQAKILEAPVTEVSGLGGKAYFMGDMLMLHVANRWVQFAITKRPGLDTKATAIRLANTTAPRIK